MKEIIKKVIDKYANSQLNIGSESSRSSLASEIEKEIMDDFDAGYQQGLSAGYTKSITLIRQLQRAIIPKNAELHNLIIDRRLEWEKLEEAIELILENIEANNRELFNEK